MKTATSTLTFVSYTRSNQQGWVIQRARELPYHHATRDRDDPATWEATAQIRFDGLHQSDDSRLTSC